jgi:hypothetical protein
MMVSEYVTRFMQLFRYAPNDVDTNEKKQECFLNGLNDGLAYSLEARDFKKFLTMIDMAHREQKRNTDKQAQAGTPKSIEQQL